MTMGLVEDSSTHKETRFRVFVDAKIVGRHDVASTKETLVAYVVQDKEELRNVRPLDGIEQTDEAELEAVNFAIDELRTQLPAFTILCDNESVVSEIKRGETRPRSRKILGIIQEKIRTSNSRIQVEYLGNLADRLLNEYVVSLEKRRDPEA